MEPSGLPHGGRAAFGRPDSRLAGAGRRLLLVVGAAGAVVGLGIVAVAGGGEPSGAAPQRADAGDDGRELLGVWSSGADSEVVGAGVCAGCHGGIAADQEAHPMARTGAAVDGANADRWFGPERLAGTVEWRSPEFPGRDRIAYDRAADGAVLKGPAGDAAVSAVFGSGLRGVTPVSFLAGRRMRELRVTWSHGKGSWIETPGSETDTDPLGDEDPARETRLCLGCHATAVEWRDGRPEATETEWGVRCERCHGPGAAHAAGWESGVGGGIFNPGMLSPRAQVGFCAQCHRNPTDFEPLLVLGRDRVLARHAGASLMMSACFRESPAERAVTCLDCHDPHRSDTDVRAASRATCLRCHQAPAEEHRYERVTASSDCVRCHLPNRAEVFAGADFTDHWIRVDGTPPGLDSPSAAADLEYLEVLYRNELVRPADARREARLRIGLGELLQASGLRGPAFEAIERGLEGEPRYEDLLKAAAIYRAEGNEDRAIGILERATIESPNSAQAFFDLGDLLLSLGRAVEAVAALEDAQQLRPNDPVIGERLAAAHQARNRDDPEALR